MGLNNLYDYLNLTDPTLTRKTSSELTNDRTAN
jgi:hypothetical protein